MIIINNDLDDLQWLYYNKFKIKCNKDIIDNAIKYKRINILRWFKKKCFFDIIKPIYGYNILIEHGEQIYDVNIIIEMLDWFVDNNYKVEYTDEIIKKCSDNNNMYLGQKSI